MPACLSGKVADPQGRVFTESSRDRGDPLCRLPLGLLAGTFQEALQSCAKAVFGCFCATFLSEKSGLPARTTSDPRHHGHRRQQAATKPGRIELNLDLFESHSRDCVAMSCASTIENRGRTGDELLPDFSLVQIRADHKERKNG